MVRSVELPVQGFEAARTCPFCAAPSHAARCGECGGALAPGGYRPLRLLSHTPFGRVFVAEHEAHGTVVVKELSFHLAPDASVIDAFERESALLQGLRDAQLPAVLEAFAEGRGAHLRLYQVQRFVPERPCRSGSRRGRCRSPRSASSPGKCSPCWSGCTGMSRPSSTAISSRRT